MFGKEKKQDSQAVSNRATVTSQVLSLTLERFRDITEG